MAKSKGTHKKPKDQRKSRRGWAEGKREEVLQPFLAKFTQAVSGCKPQTAVEEVLREVYSVFFFHFPWDKPDDWEPEELEDYDPDVIMEPEELSAEEQNEKRVRMKEKKSAIRRWLRHRAAKIRQLASKVRADRLTDPYAVLLGKLSGIQRPKKARQAYQEWQCSKRSSDPRDHEDEDDKKPNNEYIEKAVRERWASDSASQKTPHIPGPFRQKVARDLFAALPAEVRQSYKKDAEDDAKERRTEWEELLTTKNLADPVARDLALANLTDFATPILAGIEQITGCMAILEVVGPMGCTGGDISSLTIANNVNLEAKPKTLFQWHPRRMDAWREHLKQWGYTYFTAADLSKAKLPRGVQSAFGTTGAPVAATSSTDAAIMAMLATDVAGMASKDLDTGALDSDIQSDVEEPFDKTASRAPAMPATSSRGRPSTKQAQKRPRRNSSSSSSERPPRNRQKTSQTAQTNTTSTSMATARPKPKPIGRRPRHAAHDDEDDEDEIDTDTLGRIGRAGKCSRRIVIDDDDAEETGPVPPQASSPPPRQRPEVNVQKTPSRSAASAQEVDIASQLNIGAALADPPPPSPSPPREEPRPATPPQEEFRPATPQEEPGPATPPQEEPRPATPPRDSSAPPRPQSPEPAGEPSPLARSQSPVTAAEPACEQSPISPASRGRSLMRASPTPPPTQYTRWSPPPQPAPVPSILAATNVASSSRLSPPRRHAAAKETDSAAANDGIVVGDIDLPISTLLRKQSSSSTIAAALAAMRRQRDGLVVLSPIPNWMREHYNVLVAEEWGTTWAALTMNWLLYEGQNGFKNKPKPLPLPPLTIAERQLKKTKKVTIYKRPPVLDRWMKYARPPLDDRVSLSTSQSTSGGKPKSKVPRSMELPIADADFLKFTNLWHLWWDHMQPDWRVHDGTRWSRKGPWRKDWGKMVAYNQNGWMSILCCLWWWRRALDERQASSTGEYDTWNEALTDALWVLEGIRRHTEN